MRQSLRTLLDEGVDYAGLFAPAGLDMAASTRQYGDHARGPYSWALGRFVVPASRLEEFNFHFADLPGGSAGSWRLSVIAEDDFPTDVDRVKRFNRWHAERDEKRRAVVDAVEVRIASAGELERARENANGSLRVFFEVSPDRNVEESVRAIRRAGGAAKLRTGGAAPGLVPAVDAVVRFLDACLQIGVPFKATGGLQHPLRGIRPFGAEAGGPAGAMHGFLNLLLCAAFMYRGMNSGDAAAVLADESADAFRFEEAAASWRGHSIGVDVLSVARRDFALSFGSSSFDGPIGELKALKLL